MRIAILALAAGLSSCAPASSVAPAPEGSELRVSVRVIRTLPAPGTVSGEEGSSVDAGGGVADTFDGAPAEASESAEGRSHLGDLYARAGLLPEAILEYRESIALDPHNAIRHFKLGLAYQSIRRFDDALAAYQEAARLEPESAWAHAAVSIVHAKMGNQDGAFDAYQAVKKLDAEMAEGLLEVILQYGQFHEV